MATSMRDSMRSTLAGGHDFVFEYCCDFCEGEGDIKEAVGYCCDCQEYLCVECFNIHLRPKPSRHHQLLDQHQMLQDQSQNRDRARLSATLKGGSDFLYEYWCDWCEGDKQQNEAVGYCSNCRAYLCTHCFSHHTSPKPMRQHVLIDQHQMPKTRVHYVMKLPVKFGGDSYTPGVSGCVVLPGDKLVLVDKANDKVKLVNLARRAVVSQLKLSGQIRDITHVSNTQVAVTSYNTQTIYVVNLVRDKMKLDRTIKVKGQCYGIARINGNMLVSYGNYDAPVKVEIISMEGNVLQTVVTEDKGRDLFTRPWYIAVSKDQQIIYVSDMIRNTVTSIDLAGRVQATYTDTHKLKEPHGLAIGTSGMVYVCGWATNNVLQLTADLTKGRQILKKSDGVEDPLSVCYCEATDRIYVGMWRSDVVDVHQLS